MWNPVLLFPSGPFRLAFLKKAALFRIVEERVEPFSVSRAL